MPLACLLMMCFSFLLVYVDNIDMGFWSAIISHWLNILVKYWPNIHVSKSIIQSKDLRFHLNCSFRELGMLNYKFINYAQDEVSYVI